MCGGPLLLWGRRRLRSNRRSLTGAAPGHSQGRRASRGSRWAPDVGSRWRWPFTGGMHSPDTPRASRPCHPILLPSEGTTESSLSQRLSGLEPSYKSESRYPFDVRICYTAFLTTHCGPILGHLQPWEAHYYPIPFPESSCHKKVF